VEAKTTGVCEAPAMPEVLAVAAGSGLPVGAADAADPEHPATASRATKTSVGLRDMTNPPLVDHDGNRTDSRIDRSSARSVGSVDVLIPRSRNVVARHLAPPLLLWPEAGFVPSPNVQPTREERFEISGAPMTLRSGSLPPRMPSGQAAIDKDGLPGDEARGI
jgi:hypothetical protein